MADATVIKELLVSLGIKYDESALTRFAGRIGEVVAGMAKLAIAAEAASIGVTFAVKKMSEELDRLYFSIQRTGASAEGMKALEYAFGQMGLTAGAARSAVEGLASAMRMNPGIQGLLGGLGVNTNQPTEKVLQDFVKQTSNMPMFVAGRYAQMLGIDENSLLVMRRGLQGFSEEHERIFKRLGVNTEAAAKAGNTFMTQWRSLGAVVDGMQSKIVQTLGPILANDIARFKSLILDNSEIIVTAIEHIAKVILFIGDVILRFLIRGEQMFKDVRDWFNSLDPSSKVAIAAIAAIGVAWLALNALFARSPIGAAITLAAGLLFLLYDDYKEFVKNGRESALLPWDIIIPYIKQAKELVGDWLTRTKDGFIEVYAAVGNLGTAFGDLYTKIGDALGMTDEFKAFAKFMKTEFVEAMKTAGKAILNAIPDGLHALAEIIQMFAYLASGNFVAAGEVLKQMTREDLDMLKGLGIKTPNVLDPGPPKTLPGVKTKPEQADIDETQRDKDLFQTNPNAWYHKHIGAPGPSVLDTEQNNLRPQPAPAPLTHDQQIMRDLHLESYHPSRGGYGALLQNAAYTGGGSFAQQARSTIDDVVDLLKHIWQNTQDLSDAFLLYFRLWLEGKGGDGGGGFTNAAFRPGGDNTLGSGGTGKRYEGLPEGTDAPKTSSDLQQRANYIMDQLIKQLGMTPEQAAGVVSRLMAESGLDPLAFNPKGGGHGAFGIEQARGDRQKELADLVKKHPELSLFKVEVQHMINEFLTLHKDALNKIRKQDSPEGANWWMEQFEGAGQPGLGMKYGRQFLKDYKPGDYNDAPKKKPGGGGGDANMYQTNNITVHGVSDPKMAAAEVERAQHRVSATAVRNLQGTFV